MTAIRVTTLERSFDATQAMSAFCAKREVSLNENEVNLAEIFIFDATKAPGILCVTAGHPFLYIQSAQS